MAQNAPGPVNEGPVAEPGPVVRNEPRPEQEAQDEFGPPPGAEYGPAGRANAGAQAGPPGGAGRDRPEPGRWRGPPREPVGHEAWGPMGYGEEGPWGQYPWGYPPRGPPLFPRERVPMDPDDLMDRVTERIMAALGPGMAQPGDPDRLMDRVVERMLDILGPRREARGREEGLGGDLGGEPLEEAPERRQPPRERLLMAAIPAPLANSTEAGPRVEGASSVMDASVMSEDVVDAPIDPEKAREIAWEEGQLHAVVTPMLKESVLDDWVKMTRAILAAYPKVPQPRRRIIIGSKLAARPAIQAAWFALLARDSSATTTALLQRLVLQGVPEDVPGTPAGSIRPNWPRYGEGETDSVRTFTASFRMVAEAARVPKGQWGPIYVSLLRGYAATLAILFLEDKPGATYAELSQHVCDTLEMQHVAADKTALEVRVLGATEDLGIFANALRVLTQRAYGHVYQPPQVEERAAEAFVRGLTGPLKQRVREEFPESLDTALALARNLEAVGISRAAAAVAPVAPTASGPKPAVSAGVWMGNRGQAGNRGGAPQGGSNGAAQGAKPKEFVCWFCGTKGHTKRECRKKAAADAAARKGPASKNGGGEPGRYMPPEPK